jgi:hypothetical protein
MNFGTTASRFFIKTLSLTAFFTLSTIAHAESLPKDKPLKNQTKEWAHQFTAGLESFQYKYNEHTEEHKNFMKDKGMLYGVNGAYQLTYKGKIFLRPEARWAYGHTDYGNYHGEEGDRHHIPAMIFEPRLLVGGIVPIPSRFNLSPYAGLGFRYKWDDDSDIKSRDNVSGSKRINKLWYLPIGAQLQYRFNDRWFIQSIVEYDWVMKGEQLTYDRHYSPSPIVVKQKSGWGAKGELLIGHHFDKVSVAFGPYLQYWKIRKSSTKVFTYYGDKGDDYPNTPGSEPENKTREIGVKLNLIF